MFILTGFILFIPVIFMSWYPSRSLGSLGTICTLQCFHINLSSNLWRLVGQWFVLQDNGT